MAGSGSWRRRMLERAGRVDEAITWYQRTAETSSFGWLSIPVDLMVKIGRVNEAIAWLRPMAESGSEEAFRLAASLMGYDDALSWSMDFSKHSDLNLGIARHVIQLATRDRSQEEAVAWLYTINESGKTWACKPLTDSLIKLGRIDEAENILRHAVLTGKFYAIYELADLLERTGRAEEADRIRIFGFEPDGKTALAWLPSEGVTLD